MTELWIASALNFEPTDAERATLEKEGMDEAPCLMEEMMRVYFPRFARVNPLWFDFESAVFRDPDGRVILIECEISDIPEEYGASLEEEIARVDADRGVSMRRRDFSPFLMSMYKKKKEALEEAMKPRDRLLPLIQAVARQSATLHRLALALDGGDHVSLAAQCQEDNRRAMRELMSAWRSYKPGTSKEK